MRNNHASQHLHANLQIQIQEIAILSSSCRRYIPKKKWMKYLKIYHVFGILDVIRLVGCDVDSKDHDYIL